MRRATRKESIGARTRFGQSPGPSERQIPQDGGRLGTRPGDPHWAARNVP